MTTQQIESLQERIVDIALRREDEKFTEKCGNFVKQVLEKAGVPVQGQLRDVGELVEHEEGRAGDVLLFYSYDKDGKELVPYAAAIMISQSSYIWKKAGRITIQEHYSPTGFINNRIRRVTGV